MAVQHPLIDSRTLSVLVRQMLGDPVSGVSGLRQVYTPEWTSQQPDDPGVVLTMLFGKLMEIVLERLNRVPEKNFIAFLDLLGIDRLPGNSARTPIKFLLPAGNKTGGFVPAGTQVAAGPTESGTVHVFETERGLFVTPVALQNVVVLSPLADRFSEISVLADGATTVQSPLGLPQTLIEHSLYVAHDTVLGFSEAADLTLDIAVMVPPSTFPPLGTEWNVVWERCHKDAKGLAQWEAMQPIETPPGLTSQLRSSGQVVFRDFPGTAPSIQGRAEEGGGAAHWIRARLTTPLTPAVYAPPAAAPAGQLPLPQIQSLRLGITINQSDVPFDAAFFNAVPTDLSKDFYPFGREPRLADTFYLASNVAFSKKGAVVTLGVALSPGAVNPLPSADLQLRWECSIGPQRWQEVAPNDGSVNLSKGIDHSPPEGLIIFTLPDNVAPTDVNGVTAYWIRVRIVQGDYGKAAGYQEKLPATSPPQYEFVPDSFRPPVLSRITLDYATTHSPEAPQKTLTFNSFKFQDQQPTLTTPSGLFFPFEPAPEKDKDAALFLGFDPAFGDTLTSIFLHIVEDVVAAAESSSPVSWEYSNTDGQWNRLELVADETNHLATAGTVSFVGPDDLGRAEQFQHDLFWLRARAQALPADRLLKGVHLNTVQSANLTTVSNEVLGSGNGTAGQSVPFSRKPVLSGEQVYVREQEPPSAEARQALEAMAQYQLGRALTAQEKADLVQIRQNDTTGEQEVWVRWQRVDKFFGSDAQSRHYVLDRIGGVLSFGDGQAGMLPPIARDNIMASVYQSGGGSLANREVKAGDIKDLRSFLLFIDKVTNLLDASGGSDSESAADVLERGPQTIKNRDRAVTIEDFVWLARQASTLVHQAKCLPTKNDQLQFEAGAVTVLLVPDSDDPEPRPTQELMRTVKQYLLDRSLPIIQPTIYVIPPLYKAVRVRADVVATVPEESSVVEGRIVNGLNTFLHPVKGGPKGQGWEFGRNVYISEIYQLIEDTLGVDVVLSLVLNEDTALNEVEIADNELPVSGTHEIVMKASDTTT